MTPDDVRALREATQGWPFTIAVGGNGRPDDWEAERAHIVSVAEAGANWWIEWITPATRPEIQRRRARPPAYRVKRCAQAERCLRAVPVLPLSVSHHDSLRLCAQPQT